MANLEVIRNNKTLLQTMLSKVNVKEKFESMLGKKAAGFMSSIMSVVNSNEMLAECEPNSVLMSAGIAATLDLPINPNLGFSALVPYRKKGVAIAQFQIMTKGFIQLAQRSGQYKTINSSEVYEGEIKSNNRFTGEIEFDLNGRKSDKIIGYVGYFKLLNGFEKYFYMSTEDIKKHAGKYSQTYKRGYGNWNDEFDAMAKKTVMKLMLSKYGVLSIEMQSALTFDQSEVKGSISDVDNAEPIYLDNESPEAIDFSEEKVEDLLSKAASDIKQETLFEDGTAQ